MKKGRHRRFEEARELKRSHEVDIHDLFESISDAPADEHKPEHDAWADLAEEWDSKADAAAVSSTDDAEAADADPDVDETSEAE